MPQTSIVSILSIELNIPHNHCLYSICHSGNIPEIDLIRDEYREALPLSFEL
jgi:hypothetical protein